MSLASGVAIFAALWGAVAAQDGTKELKPEELPQFRILYHGHYPAQDSPTAGNQIRNYFLSFYNGTDQEIASVDVRFTSGEYTKEPIRIEKFNDYFFHNETGAIPGRKSFSLGMIPIDRSKKDWEASSNLGFEIVSIRVYTGKQDLHNIGHFYTWLRKAPDAEAIKTIKADPSLATAANSAKYTNLSVAYTIGSIDVVKAMVAAAGFGEPELPLHVLPIHLAAGNPHTEVLDYVVKRGQSVNAKADGDQTPLMFAFFYNNLPGARWLLKHGADPNQEGKNNILPVTYAMIYGDADAVLLLIQAGGTYKGHDANGYGWMHYAASLNDVGDDVRDLLLKRGLSANDVDPKFGITPLMAAAKAGRTNAVDWLLHHGANPKLVDKQGKDAFAYARDAGGDGWLKQMVNGSS